MTCISSKSLIPANQEYVCFLYCICWGEGCPRRKCHKSMGVLVHWGWTMVVEIELPSSFRKVRVYNTTLTSTVPICYLLFKSCIMQELCEKINSQWSEDRSLEIEMRLKVKEGIYKTLVRWKEWQKWILPECVA